MFFFILPVGVDFRARRYPVVTFTLMGICALVYLVQLLLQVSGGAAVEEWVVAYLWLIPADSYWWSYLTSLFVHEGFFHLAGNMVYLFLFGSCVEDLIGRTRFTIFYLVCGVAAEFAHIAVAPDHFASEIALGGASGAISGCIGGFLLLLAKTRIEFKWLFFFFFRIWAGEFFLPAWLVISFWFLEDVASMVLVQALNPGGGGVAFAAHVGGTLFGVGLIALQKLHWKYHPPETDEEEEEEAELAPAKPAVARPAARVRVRVRPQPVAVETPTLFLSLDGAQSGPYTLLQIEQMFAAGTLAPGTWYWQQGMEEWRSADELRQPGWGG